MSKRLDSSELLAEALDHCLDLLAQGESAETCLARYPQLAEELRPLLKSTAELRGMASLQLSQAAREKIRARILHEFSRSANRKSWFAFGAWRWASASAAAILAMAVLGAGTVRASLDSLPGSPMYEVKIATEQVQLALARSDTDRARIHAELADKRAQEMASEVRFGKAKEVSHLGNKLNRHIERALELTRLEEESPSGSTTPSDYTPLPARARDTPTDGPQQMVPAARTGFKGPLGPVRQTLRQRFIIHQRMLEAAIEEAPPAHRPALRKTLGEHGLKYRKLLERLGEASQEQGSP